MVWLLQDRMGPALWWALNTAHRKKEAQLLLKMVRFACLLTGQQKCATFIALVWYVPIHLLITSSCVNLYLAMIRRLCTERKSVACASCLYDNNILATTAVWSPWPLCCLLFLWFLIDIGTSERGGCDDMIHRRQKYGEYLTARKKCDGEDTSAFLRDSQ